jgi:putative SOS response-associated peptidase YedK
VCGRFTLTTPPELIAEHFGLDDVPPLGPRYNIAPTQPVPVVRKTAQGRRLEMLRWGLVPSWAGDPSIGNRLINARAETVADKPSFRSAYRRRRCLVVADGFFEWKRVGVRKQPMYIRLRDQAPFAFAGLWESWHRDQPDAVESCTLITTGPNALLATIHDRMPVILHPDDYARWLDPGAGDPARLLRPYPAAEMTAHPVSRRVNSPANDDPACVEAIDE